MSDRVLPFLRLKKILRRYGVWVDEDKGKGSHVCFCREFADGVFTYPVPKDKDVLVCYVKRVRRKLRLTPEDGISDKDFYGD